MESVAMQTTQCGTAAEKPETAFTVNGILRPKIDIAPGERQFWRIVNGSPDLYADLEVDSVSLEVVALDGMPFAYHDPSIRTRSMSHVLLPPALPNTGTSCKTSRQKPNRRAVCRCLATTSPPEPTLSSIYRY
jgi:hypothetical protein